MMMPLAVKRACLAIACAVVLACVKAPAALAVEGTGSTDISPQSELDITDNEVSQNEDLEQAPPAANAVDKASAAIESEKASLALELSRAASNLSAIYDDMRSSFHLDIPSSAQLEADRIESGAYTIESLSDSGLPTGALADNDSSFAIEAPSNTADQRFTIQIGAIDETFAWNYRIENVSTGLVLSDENADNMLSQSNYAQTSSQLWTITKQDGQGITLANSATSRKLVSSQDRRVFLGDATATTSDTWLLEKASPTIPNGAYTISADENGTVIGVGDDATSAYARLAIMPAGEQVNRQFGIAYDASTGYYRLVSYASGLPVGTAFGTDELGAQIEQRYQLDPGLALWSVERSGNGAFTISAASSGYALGMRGSDLVLVAPSSASSFSLHPTVPTMTGDIVNIRNGANGYAMIDVEDSSLASNAALELRGENASPTQKFKLIWNDDGSFRFCNVQTGLYLTAHANGTIAQAPYDNDGTSQVWVAVPSPDGHFSIVLASDPGACLGAPQTTGGTNLEVNSGKGAASEWNVIATPLVEEGCYTFSLRANGELSLDVSNASLFAGANIQAWTANGLNAQKFYLDDQGDGTYLIVSAWSNLNLDVVDGVSSAGTNVQQYYDNGNIAQHWYVDWSPAGGYVFRSAVGPFALAATGGYAGANIELAAYSPGDPLQAFRLMATAPTALSYDEQLAILDSLSGNNLNVFRSRTGISQQTLNNLYDAIARYESAGLSVGFALFDLATGSGVTYNADTQYYSASTIKGPYVIALNHYWPDTAQRWTAQMWNAINWSSNYDYETLRYVFGSQPIDRLVEETHAWGFNTGSYYTDYSALQLAKLWTGMARYLMSNDANAAWCRDVFGSNSSITSRPTLAWKGCLIYAKSGWLYSGCHNEGCLVMDGDHPYIMTVMTTDVITYPARMSNLMTVLDQVHAELIE